VEPDVSQSQDRRNDGQYDEGQEDSTSTVQHGRSLPRNTAASPYSVFE
jgi:hypothetical protein